MTKAPPNSDLEALGSRILSGLQEQFNEPKLELSEAPELLANASRCTLYKFSLTGFVQSPELNHQTLVCKLDREGKAKLVKEAKVTRLIHDLGYPAPQVLCFCREAKNPDFLVMTYLEGRNILPYSMAAFFGGLCVGILWSWFFAVCLIVVLSSVFAVLYTTKWQELHGLDPDLLLRGGGEELIFGQDFLSSLEQRARASGCDIDASLLYLRNNLPSAQGVICHGDFHFWNIKTNPSVTGVIDWEETLVAPRELDLAWFRVVRDWMDIPDKDQPLDRLIAKVFFFGFAAQLKLMEVVYRIRFGLDQTLMNYFTVLHLTKGLIAIAEVESEGGTWTMRTMEQRLRHRLDKLLQ